MKNNEKAIVGLFNSQIPITHLYRLLCYKTHRFWRYHKMNYKKVAINRIKKAKNNRFEREKNNRERRIEKLRSAIKNEDEYLEKCKEYGESPNFADTIKISFDPNLDVSAKTVNGDIFLNDKLYDKPWDVQMRYVIHEMTHCFQQKNGKVNGKVDKDEYLDDKNEQEAFTAQISYMCEHDSPEEIQEYIENLLTHHNIKGKERKEKAQKLTEDL